MILSQHLNNNIFFRNKDSTSSPSPKKFGIFLNRQQDKADKENGNTMTLSRVGQRFAVFPNPAGHRAWVSYPAGPFSSPAEQKTLSTRDFNV